MKLYKIRIILYLFIAIISTSFAQEEIWYAKGEQAMMKAKFDDAIKSFSKVINKNPSNAGAYFNRGQAYLFKNVFDSAAMDFSKTIELAPERADAWNNRGLAIHYVGQYDNAILDFNKALELDSNFSEAYINRGTTYASLLVFEKALADLNKAQELDAKNPAIYYQRAGVYYKQREYAKSAEDYTKTIEYGMKNSKVYYSRGNAYYKNKDYEKAIKDYSKAYQLDPNDDEALNNRAVAYDKIGKKDSAEADRQLLNKKSGNKYLPIDNIPFKTYNDSTESYYISLPEGWHSCRHIDENISELLIAYEPVLNINDPYVTGVRLVSQRGLSKLYPIKTPPEIINFWKGSALKNAENYTNYTILSEKSFHAGDWNGTIIESYMRIKEDYPPMRLLEMIVVKGDDIVYGYFQSTEKQYGYFEKVFDKALKSLYVKK
ncbi:MAG: hypothetical protein HW421_2581 [Ignavibacteria bacterium]|nr:hypothetical protein [Ignavibacteria bacterium]